VHPHAFLRKVRVRTLCFYVSELWGSAKFHQFCYSAIANLQKSARCYCRHGITRWFGSSPPSMPQHGRNYCISCSCLQLLRIEVFDSTNPNLSSFASAKLNIFLQFWLLADLMSVMPTYTGTALTEEMGLAGGPTVVCPLPHWVRTCSYEYGDGIVLINRPYFNSCLTAVLFVSRLYRLKVLRTIPYCKWCLLNVFYLI
jgi:hypothetical protein